MHTVTAPLFCFFVFLGVKLFALYLCTTTTVLEISSCSSTSHDNNPSLHKFPPCVYSDPGISALLSVHQRMLGKQRRRGVRRDRRGLRWFVVCGDLPSLLFVTHEHTHSYTHLVLFSSGLICVWALYPGLSLLGNCFFLFLFFNSFLHHISQRLTLAKRNLCHAVWCKTKKVEMRFSSIIPSFSCM